MVYLRDLKARGTLQLEKLMRDDVRLNKEAEFECG